MSVSTPFERFASYIIDIEGGYSNNPNDPGRETKYGISKRYHPLLDIKNLTIPQAVDIYKTEYWDKFSCGLLSSPLGIMLCDGVVNQGSSVVLYLQKVLNVRMDGVIGAETLNKAKVYDKSMLAKLAACRMYEYGLSPRFKDERGWCDRLMICYGVCKDEEKYL